MKYYIARDKDGLLAIYDDKPILDKGSDGYYGDDWLSLDDKLFPEITWDNSPVEVEIKIKD